MVNISLSLLAPPQEEWSGLYPSSLSRLFATPCPAQLPMKPSSISHGFLLINMMRTGLCDISGELLTMVIAQCLANNLICLRNTYRSDTTHIRASDEHNPTSSLATLSLVSRTWAWLVKAEFHRYQVLLLRPGDLSKIDEYFGFLKNVNLTHRSSEVPDNKPGSGFWHDHCGLWMQTFLRNVRHVESPLQVATQFLAMSRAGTNPLQSLQTWTLTHSCKFLACRPRTGGLSWDREGD